MDNPECPGYNKDFAKLEEKINNLNEKVDKLLEQNENKDAEEEVEIDLREKKLELLRRAVSNYLAHKKSNMEDI